jgi:glyoxylase-like metal-dependent hydrolase (beta-lactamase superfamily II)
MEFKTVKRILNVALALMACGAIFSLPAAPEGQDSSGIDVIKVRQNFYMLAGAGGNIGVQIGADGVVLVNAGNGMMTDQVLAALKKLTPLPIRYVIDTNADADFVSGNSKLSKAGQTIFTNTLGGGAGDRGAAILAHDSILNRMSATVGKSTLFPTEDWPTEAFYPKRQTLRMNDEGIEVLYQPAAHSNADSFVLFRASDVVVTGDVMDATRFPVIDVANGGSVQGEIDALNRLIDLTIAPTPFIYKDVGTYVIPGHGRLCEQMEVVDYRDMVVLVRDVVADLIKQGKTLDQIKAARPALPYETRYGSQTGSWTTNAFIEAVYRSLNAAKK